MMTSPSSKVAKVWEIPSAVDRGDWTNPVVVKTFCIQHVLFKSEYKYIVQKRARLNRGM